MYTILEILDLVIRAYLLVTLKLVYNFNLISFLSRIGRGGRFGRKGVAINFITDGDRRALQELEQHYHTEIEEMPCNVADLI